MTEREATDRLLHAIRAASPFSDTVTTARPPQCSRTRRRQSATG